MPSVPFSAFLGEEVISLSPFVDNNPPSFQSLVQDGDSGASEERWLGARRSNLSMRSLWGGSSVAGTRMAHSVAPVKGIEDEIGANYERGVAAFGAALLEDVLFTGSPQIGGERAHGVRGLSSGISVGGSPPRGSPVASGRGSLFGASPRRSLLALESSGLGTTAMGSPGSLRGTALSGSSGCGPGSVTGSPRSGSSQATGPRIMSDAFASASPSASTSFTFTEGNASMRHRHEISGTQSPVVSLLSEAHAAETATVRNQQSRFFASVRAASSRASLRDLFHRRGGDLAHAETAQGGREEMEIGEAVGQQQRGLGKWRAGRSRGRMFNGLVDGLLGKFKKERSNVGLESGSGVGVMGTRAVA
ncbi:hypothetical protein BC830DRAFT_1117677 [Chytriomyces sp. MP71]|nr:hypothetical protein BC830DRAFT_1117677 [Chytriomyces sp. MP71]